MSEKYVLIVDFIKRALLIFTVSIVAISTRKKAMELKTIGNVNIDSLYIWAEFGAKWAKN